MANRLHTETRFYTVETDLNGFLVTVTRKDDGASLLFQDHEAYDFIDELEKLTNLIDESDEIAIDLNYFISQYDDVME
jgi:hypothetical protein